MSDATETLHALTRWTRSCLIHVLWASVSIFGVRQAAAAELHTAALVRMDMAAEERTGHLQTAEATIDLDAEIAWREDWSVTARVRMRADGEDRLEPGSPDQRERSRINRRWLLGERADAELRELYIDGRVGATFVRIGKQQVVWGQADGLRVLDIVNPFSFREFVWPDPQDRRIPLWTVNAQVPIGGATLQLLWLPDPTFDEIPLGEAAFAVTTPLLVPRGPVSIPVAPSRRPGLASSDAGARLSAFVGGWDLTLNYLHHYYDDPVPFVASGAAGAFIEPSYERSDLFGGSFSRAFGSTTIRGELGYSTDRWFITTDAHDADRVFRSNELAFVVGLDSNALADTLISAQYLQSAVLQPVALMTRERTERQATLLVQRSFRNEAWKLRVLYLHSINRGDGALQARLSWQASDHLSLGVSIERFHGDRDGLFGEFRDASRAGIDVQWSWLRGR